MSEGHDVHVIRGEFKIKKEDEVRKLLARLHKRFNCLIDFTVGESPLNEAWRPVKVNRTGRDSVNKVLSLHQALQELIPYLHEPALLFVNWAGVSFHLYLGPPGLQEETLSRVFLDYIKNKLSDLTARHLHELGLFVQAEELDKRVHQMKRAAGEEQS